MGYYATWGGVLGMKEAPPKTAMRDLNNVFEDAYYDSKKKTLELYGHEKYHEDDVYNALNEIKDIVESGEIEFTGEDDSHWRIYKEDDEWREESGAVYYESEINTAQNDKDEFIGRIIDIIQDSIDNPKGDTIKGEWYDEIADEITSIMKTWKVFS